MMKRLFVSALFLLLFSIVCAGRAEAQETIVPDTLIPAGLRSSTERFEGTQATTLSLDHLLNFSLVDLRARALYHSTTSLPGERQTRDQLDAMVDALTAGTAPLRPLVHAEGTLTTDVRALGDGSGATTTATALGGFGTQLRDTLGNWIAATVGGGYSRQLNREDYGPALYSEGHGRFDMESYLLSLDGAGRWSSTAPRTNINAQLAAQLDHQGEEGDRLTLRTTGSLISSDLYLRAPGSDTLPPTALVGGILRRAEREVEAAALVHTLLTDDIGLLLDATASSRVVERAERAEEGSSSNAIVSPFQLLHDEVGLRLATAMVWTPEDGAGTVRLEYETKEERNTVTAASSSIGPVDLERRRQADAQGDFTGVQLRLSTEATWRPTARDTLHAGALIGIYRYDTPSALNAFDRDEQTIQAGLGYGRFFDRSLQASVVVQTFLTHLVYLFGENSNDNNRTVILRFAPSVRYAPGERFENLLGAEVTANYTVYDFEDRAGTIRGRSFRSLALRDSLRLRAGRGVELRSVGELRVGDRAIYDGARFAERPVERTRTGTLIGDLLFNLGDGVTLGGGVRYSHLTVLRAPPLQGALEPFSSQASIGPTFRLEAFPTPNVSVSANGWLEHRLSEGDTPAVRIPWLTLTAAWWPGSSAE